MINVNWDAFVPGTSIFIPAVDTSRLEMQVKHIAYKLEIKIKGIERIEGGRLGMRFWRIS